MSALAKEQPSIYFATVSPGGTKTNLFQNTPQPMFCMIQCSSPPLGSLLLLRSESPSLCQALRIHLHVRSRDAQRGQGRRALRRRRIRTRFPC